MPDYLCEELIVEIFTRLPPKSLIRFTSLSKSLRSCIGSSSFIRMHTSRSPQRLIFTHVVKYQNREDYDGHVFFHTLHAVDELPLCPIRGYIGITTVKFPWTDLHIVGSCNGIICLFDWRTNIICLWNPSIRRQLTLPNCPRRRLYKAVIGIGFDPITNDTKIVRIPENGRTVTSSFVYAMKTGNWSPIAPSKHSYTRVVSTACFVNGLLHWVVFTNSKGVDPCYILTFDLSTHVFGMIALPKPWKSFQVTNHLTTIQDSLAVHTKVNNDISIWVRRNDSWSVVFKLKIHPRGVWKVVELTNNGDLLLNTYCKGIQVYNPKREAQSRLVDFNDASYLSSMYMYVESLQLLDMGTACDVNQHAGKKRKRSSLDLSTEYQKTIEYSDYIF